MKIYNYNTKRLYEAESTIKLSLVEFDDEDNQIGGTKEFTNPYASVDEAIDDAEEIMKNIASEEGIDPDDIEFEEDEDVITFTVPGFGKWVFTAGPIVTAVRDEVHADGDEDDELEECDKVAEDELEECGVTEDEIEECDGTEECDDVKESVAERFMRMRKMFESDEDEEEKEDEETEDETSDEDNKGEDTKDDKEEKEDAEDEDEEMKAVVITVKKGDEDKCKDEMVEAGIAEEDIEILDADDDDENVDIRIDVNSVLELKDYLEKKGIDLEEEIGGEIVSDEEEGEEEEKADSEEGSDEEDDEEDFDFDKIGDIFGDEE